MRHSLCFLVFLLVAGSAAAEAAYYDDNGLYIGPATASDVGYVPTGSLSSTPSPDKAYTLVDVDGDVYAMLIQKDGMWPSTDFRLGYAEPDCAGPLHLYSGDWGSSYFRKLGHPLYSHHFMYEINFAIGPPGKTIYTTNDTSYRRVVIKSWPSYYGSGCITPHEHQWEETTAYQAVAGPNVLDYYTPPYHLKLIDPGASGARPSTHADALDSAVSKSDRDFEELLHVDLDTNGGDLKIDFTFAQRAQQLFSIQAYRLVVNGTVVTSTHAMFSSSGAISALVPVPAGANTVSIEWAKKSGPGVVEIDPAVTGEHASLVVREVN